MAKLITELEIKTSEAKNKIKELREAIKKGDGDVVALKDQLKKLEEQDKNTASSLREIKKSTEDARKSFSGLKDTLKGFDGSFDSFKNIGAALKDAKGAFSSLSSVSGGAGGAIANMAGASGGLGAAMGALVNPVTLAIAAVAGIGAVCVEAVKKFEDFKGSLNDLQALTGLTDEAMKGIKDGIIQVSNETGVAAEEIASSMGLIGSQAPELLKTPAALLEVTKAANVLAQAAGIASEDAAKGITTIINQLGASAGEANEIVNALAAGQANGAASVEYLNKAIEKAGTQAKQAGMGYTELISVVESIAPKFSSADVAGSQLNSTLLKLSMGADEFNPAIVGMQTALQNLSEAELDNAAMKDLVGESNVTMLSSLIEAKDAIYDFQAGIEGTNAAYDQAAIKTKGMNAAIDNLSLAWDNFLLTLGGSDELQEIVDGLATAINWIAEAIKLASKNVDVLIGYFKALYAPISGLIDVIVAIVDGIRGAKSPTEALKAAALGLVKPFTTIYELITKIIGKLKDEPDWDSLIFDKPAKIINKEGEKKEKPKEEEETKKPKVKEPKPEKVKVEPELAEGSIAALRKDLKDLNSIFEETGDATIRANVKLQIDQKQAELDKLLGKDKKNPEVKVEPKIDIDKLNEDYKKAIDNLVSGKTDAIKTVASEFDNLTNSIVAFSDAIQNGDGFAAFEAFGQSILNTLDNIQQFSEAMNQMKTAQQAASAAVAAGASTEIAANSAKAASNIATTGTELTAAGAKATSSAAGLPFPANLAAMAAALGAVMSMVSMVKGLGKFANGGIVSGATSIGDYNLARVNSGEMILNGKQQQNLFNQLNQPSQRAESSGNSNVQFKISGRELVGVLNNYNTFRN